MSRSKPVDSAPKKAPVEKPVVPISDRVAVSASEAGALLGISRARVFQLIAAGELPSFKIGKLRRFRTEDVRAFAARMAATAQQAAA